MDEDLPKPKRARAALLLCLVLLIALAVRVVYLREASRLPNFRVPYAGMDAALYRDLAQRVSEGDLLLGEETFYFTPLYAYTLGGLYAVFGADPWVSRILNCYLGLLTVCLLFLLTRRIFRSAGAGFFAGLGGALYGPYLVFDTSGLKTSMGLTLLVLALWLIARRADRPRARTWILPGVVLGVAMSFYGTLSLFLAAFCVWLFFSRSAGRLASVACFLLGAVAVTLPVGIRNEVAAEELSFTRNTGGIHFYIANSDRAWGGYAKVQGVRPNPAGHHFDARHVAEQATGRGLTSAEVSSWWRARAVEQIKGEPEHFSWLVGKRALLLLNAFEVPNNESYAYRKEESGLLPFLPGYGVLLALGLLGMAVLRFRRQEATPLYLLFAGVFLALLFSLVTWRYRLPVTLALWPFAGYFLSRLASWTKRSRVMPIVATVAAGAMLWVAADRPVLRQEVLDGSERIARMKMEASRIELELCRELAGLDPSQGDKRRTLVLSLAGLRRNQHDLEGAVDVLREALRSNPGDLKVRYVLLDLQEELTRATGRRRSVSR